jgi:hypothetical protein
LPIESKSSSPSLLVYELTALALGLALAERVVQARGIFSVEKIPRVFIYVAKLAHFLRSVTLLSKERSAPIGC